jgi:16S rRNA (guanine527-N7)-methyltransferase
LAGLLADGHAPTAVHDPIRIWQDHVADSLVALELAPVRHASLIADLGSGAGLPGLPLAIARPEAQFWLVESNQRKADFIARAARDCGLGNVGVVAVRAEEWAGGRGVCELVTVRALAALPVAAEYAAPLLKPGGALLAWRGRRDPEEERAAGEAAAELGLQIEAPRRVEPYSGAANRHLQLMVKVGPTPTRFPRRPGMARKRPLGVRTVATSDRFRR